MENGFTLRKKFSIRKEFPNGYVEIGISEEQAKRLDLLSSKRVFDLRADEVGEGLHFRRGRQIYSDRSGES